MTTLLLDIYKYVKNPVLISDENKDLHYRFTIFFKILILSILTGFAISPIFSFLEYINLVDLKNHKVDLLFKNMPLYQILLIGAVFVPIIEELMFRPPRPTR